MQAAGLRATAQCRLAAAVYRNCTVLFGGCGVPLVVEAEAGLEAAARCCLAAAVHCWHWGGCALLALPWMRTAGPRRLRTAGLRWLRTVVVRRLRTVGLRGGCVSWCLQLLRTAGLCGGCIHWSCVDRTLLVRCCCAPLACCELVLQRSRIAGLASTASCCSAAAQVLCGGSALRVCGSVWLGCKNFTRVGSARKVVARLAATGRRWPGCL